MPPLPPADDNAPFPPPIQGVDTSTAAILGETARGPTQPTEIYSLRDFQRLYGDAPGLMADAIRGFFDNGGRRAVVVRIVPGADGPATLADYEGVAGDENLADGATGLAALEYSQASLIYAPDALATPGLAEGLIAHCERLRSRFAVIDAPRDGDPLGPRAAWDSRYGACYHPWLSVADSPGSALRRVPPGGHVLGVFARVDANRGVHKPPANEVVIGALGLEREIAASEQGRLTAAGVNVIRTFPGRGIRVWGARTLASDPEWKYVSLVRLFIFLERSIYQSLLQWVVFEPNGDQLWARVQDTVRQFLRAQWTNGALQGSRDNEAYFVRCDHATMTQEDLDDGRMVCEIGVAPLKPAEFVILRIGLWTADQS